MENNNKIEIIPGGINRHPSDKVANNGELDDCVNLESVYGELRPVFPPEKISGITGLLFVHQYPEYELWLHRTSNSILCTKYQNGVFTSTNFNLVIANDEIPAQIQAIGNTVIIPTNKRVIYILHKKELADVYHILGSDIPFPVIRPYLTNNNRYEETTENMTVFLSGKIKIDISPLYFDSYAKSQTMSSGDQNAINQYNSTRKMFSDQYMAKILKKISEFKTDGYFSFPFFVRYALRMYDGTLIKHSPPFLLNPCNIIYSNPQFKSRFRNAALTFNGQTNNEGTVLMLLTKLSVVISRELLKFDMYICDGLDNWKDIIKSVDVFISAPIYTLNQSGEMGDIGRDAVSNPVEINSATNYHWFSLPEFSNEEILSKITEESNFYFLQSIELDKFSSAMPTEFRTEPADIRKNQLNTLLQQEVMTDDYGSHNRLSAEYSYAYNNKLHLLEIKQRLFEGFYAVRNGQMYWTDIKDVGIVQTTFPNRNQFSIADNIFLYYPDKRATCIFESSFNGYKLKKHPTLNGAYYLNEKLEPAEFETYQTAVDLTVNDKEYLPNKLYTSVLNNPFLFRANGIFNLPAKGIGLGTTTEAMSQGQFGQFPLYLLTERGIWAMEINSEGKYVARQIITREICTNPKSILQLRRQIAFITEKGLGIISGTDTEIISTPIEDSNYKLANCNISELLTATNNSAFEIIVNSEPTFSVFIKNARPAYDPVNERIYLYNPEFKYSYIFNLISKQWTKTDDAITNAVNDYPYIYFEKIDGIYKPKLNHTGAQKVCFITRAIKANDVHFIISQLKMIGTVRAHENVFALYGSRDGTNYVCVASTYDQVLRMRGSGYKYFKIAYSGSLSNDESISTFEAIIETKLTNKLR